MPAARRTAGRRPQLAARPPRRVRAHGPDRPRAPDTDTTVTAPPLGRAGSPRQARDLGFLVIFRAASPAGAGPGLPARWAVRTRANPHSRSLSRGRQPPACPAYFHIQPGLTHNAFVKNEMQKRLVVNMIPKLLFRKRDFCFFTSYIQWRSCHILFRHGYDISHEKSLLKSLERNYKYQKPIHAHSWSESCGLSYLSPTTPQPCLTDCSCHQEAVIGSFEHR